MTDYCEMSDLPVETCAHCLGHAQTAAEQPPTTGSISVVMAARYETTCRCGNKIEVEDTIAKTEDGRWVCVDCAREA